MSKKELRRSGLTHNFNNLMGVLVSRANLLLHKVRDTKLVSDIDIIRDIALEASEFVQRLQKPSLRQSLGKRSWVDINGLLAQVVEMTRRPPMSVQLNLKEVPDLYVSRSALREVFMNLILNAVEALSVRKGTTRRKIVIRTDYDKNRTKIFISDSGAGIPKKILDNIFKPFFSTKNSDGRGLGLSSSREIVCHYKGQLTVESKKGMGTTFCISFPVSKSAKTRFKNKKYILHPVANARRVLFVDDEKDYREATAELLTLEGYEVDEAVDGKEALKKIKQKDYEIIVSDVRMPSISGMELARKIKEISDKIHIILLSGSKRHRKSRYVDGWLTKPCNVEDIREAIETLCR